MCCCSCRCRRWDASVSLVDCVHDWADLSILFAVEASRMPLRTKTLCASAKTLSCSRRRYLLLGSLPYVFMQKAGVSPIVLPLSPLTLISQHLSPLSEPTKHSGLSMVSEPSSNTTLVMHHQKKKRMKIFQSIDKYTTKWMQCWRKNKVGGSIPVLITKPLGRLLHLHCKAETGWFLP